MSSSYLVSMRMLVLIKKDSTVNVSKEIFRPPFINLQNLPFGCALWKWCSRNVKIKTALLIFDKFSEKYLLFWSSFLIKLQLCNLDLYKEINPYKSIFKEICQNFKKSISHNTPHRCFFKSIEQQLLFWIIFTLFLH